MLEDSLIHTLTIDGFDSPGYVTKATARLCYIAAIATTCRIAIKYYFAKISRVVAMVHLATGLSIKLLIKAFVSMKKNFHVSSWLYAVTAAIIVYAGPDSAAPTLPLAARIPATLLAQDYSFLTITVENDLFGSGKDEHYTSGIRLTYFDDHIDPPAIIRNLSLAVPFFEINDTTRIYYSLGQNLYTPENIVTSVPDPTDRPYAAFLYGSVGYTTLAENHIDDVELTLGVVGPAAAGKQTQTFVHRLIGSDIPLGWEHQLNNEPAFIIAYQRSWPEAFALDLDPVLFRVAPHAGITLGNIYDYVAAGVTLQWVPTRHPWQTPPARVRPAIPGSGYFAIPRNEFSWSFFAGIEGRAVARNIFLDGNTFSNSPSVDKNSGVLDASAGFTLTWGWAQVAYTLNWRSDEFQQQGDNSLFGSVSLGFRF